MSYGDTVVTIGECVISNAGLFDADGNEWLLAGLDGWYGQPAMRRNATERSQQDGNLPAGRALRTAKTITITGRVYCNDETALYRAIGKLERLLLAGDRYGVLTVAEGAGKSLQAIVSRDGETLVARVGDSTLSFSISVTADDPSRYGSDLRTASVTRFMPGAGYTYPYSYPIVYGANGSSGQVLVQNDGTVETFPVITFVGGSNPLVNPTVRLVGGSQLSFLWTIATNADPLVLDTASRYATVGGNSRRSSMTTDSTWFTLPPGPSILLFTADSGDAAQMRVDWRDAYA